MFHFLKDLDSALCNVNSLLKAGGMLLFNYALHAGSFLELIRTASDLLSGDKYSNYVPQVRN